MPAPQGGGGAAAEPHEGALAYGAGGDAASSDSSRSSNAAAAAAYLAGGARGDTFADRDQQQAAAAAALLLQRGAAPAGAGGGHLYRRAGPHSYAPPACNPPAPPSGRGHSSGGGGGGMLVGAGGAVRAAGGGGGGAGQGLPESTPAPVADPTEAAYLEAYLQLVRETHGTEAAAAAAASSGATGQGGAPAAALASVYGCLPPPSRPSSRPGSRPTSSDGPLHAQQPPMGGRGRGGEAGLPGGDAPGGGREVVSSMLGFIRDRKLATNNPPLRRPSIGSDSSSSSVSSASGSKNSMKIWIQPSGGWGCMRRATGGPRAGWALSACMRAPGPRPRRRSTSCHACDPAHTYSSQGRAARDRARRTRSRAS
jgi:hypothetical protein